MDDFIYSEFIDLFYIRVINENREEIL